MSDLDNLDDLDDLGYPIHESIEEVKAAAAAYNSWRDEKDRSPEKVTPPSPQSNAIDKLRDLLRQFNESPSLELRKTALIQATEVFPAYSFQYDSLRKATLDVLDATSDPLHTTPSCSVEPKKVVWW